MADTGPTAAVEAFIAKWKGVAASELSTTQTFAAPQRQSRRTPPTPWPRDPIDQVRAVADVLAASPTPLSIDEIAARFTARGPWKKRLPQLLEMLVALGRAETQPGGLYLAAL